ncbi:hypothetical protein GW17_00058310, partial [Ensete ventricosum]
GRSAYRQPDVLVVVRSAIPLDIAHIDVHTGPLVDRNVDHPLPGGTANWGCFRLITTQNRLVKVDFDRRWSLSGGNGRFRLSAADFGRYQPREKEEEGEEEEEKGEHGVWCCSPDPFARVIRHLRAISSPRTGRKNVATHSNLCEGAVCLARSLKIVNEALTSLDLGFNEIRVCSSYQDKGAFALAQALKANEDVAVASLNLASNFLTKYGQLSAFQLSLINLKLISGRQSLWFVDASPSFLMRG